MFYIIVISTKAEMAGTGAAAPQFHLIIASSKP